MKRWLTVGAILAAVVGGSGGTAYATANSSASCEGIGSSDSAPGQNDRLKARDFGFGPGASIRAFIALEHNAEAKAAGVPPGVITAQDVAQQHLGSPAACFPEEQP
jgi:hypothetical protein